MKIDVIAFSVTGEKLAKRIIAGFNKLDNDVNGYIAKRHAENTDFKEFSSIYEITAQLFNNTDALVFIGSCGMAVRAVAPLIKSKLIDPAVVVCDEAGIHAISLLSGHVGGANKLTEQIAKIIGANPVITTASDVHSISQNKYTEKNLVLGIGCRKGVLAETIERSATILLWDEKIPLARISEVATIDIKRHEEGLLGFTEAHKLPIHFYSAKELMAVEGEFLSSKRVLEAVGVDNVCERAATLCGKKGKLIVKKTAKDGVAIAVFEKE